jgi:WXG100 family type VII secretion target
MTESFHIDLEHLDDIVSRLGTLADLLTDRVEQLDNHATGLRNQWSGSAADAYADAHRQWSAGAKEFRDGIRDMRAAAARAHAHYQAAGSANKRMFGGGR